MGGPGGAWGVWSLNKLPPPALIDVVIGGRFGPADVPRLWDRVRARLAGRTTVVVTCDVAELDRPDAATVEALARLQLAARRSGCRVRLRHACGELRDLLELMGLSEVVPCSGSDLEPGREVEQGEPPGGVEEERDPVDPVA
jgi:ABC-type transporter Mla MlaB component